MAICNYCKEEVKDEAIKCKHCGEWLKSKERSLSFGSFSKFASDSISKINKLQTDIYGSNESIIPTDEAPLTLEGLELYPDFILFKGIKYDYNRIARLTNYYSEQTLNMRTNRYCTVGVSFDYLPIHNLKWLLEFNDSKFSLKKVRICRNIGNYLAHKSYENRLNLYIEELNNTGKINYKDNIVIYKNGFISKDDTKLNLNTSFRNDLLWIGVNRGFQSHTGSSNPYEVLIREKKELFQEKIKFEATIDFDVISYIIPSLIKA